jgi:hypothetical protein
MDQNIGIGLKAEAHATVADVQHGDLEHALEAHRSSDHHRLLAFSRQNQHGRTSVFRSNGLASFRSRRPQALARRAKHPHNGAGGEQLQDGPGHRRQFRGGLQHFHTGDSIDFLQQRAGRVRKQLPVKFLHAGGSAWGPGQGRLCGREGSMQGNDQRVCMENHAHGLGRMACALLLE